MLHQSIIPVYLKSLPEISYNNQKKKLSISDMTLEPRGR